MTTGGPCGAISPTLASTQRMSSRHSRIGRIGQHLAVADHDDDGVEALQLLGAQLFVGPRRGHASGCACTSTSAP